MNEAMIMTTAAFGLAGLTVAVAGALKGWQGWLELKRMELGGRPQPSRSPAIERIEIADLKERIRKLETIASGVDL